MNPEKPPKSMAIKREAKLHRFLPPQFWGTKTSGFPQVLGARGAKNYSRKRSKVLQQGDRIQKETTRRLEAIKQQAPETKKAASGAAWWLFSTALTSLVASAIAGILAVRTAFSFFI